MGMSALRAWSKKTKMTTLTTIISSMSVCRSVCDRFFDELRSIVRRDDRDALGEARLDLAQSLLDGVDDRQRVLAVAHDDDAAGRLALAVQLREAAADVRADADLRHVPHANRASRSTTLIGLRPMSSGSFT